MFLRGRGRKIEEGKNQEIEEKEDEVKEEIGK